MYRILYIVCISVVTMAVVCPAQTPNPWQQSGGPVGAVVQGFFVAGNDAYAIISNTLYRYSDKGWEQLGESVSDNYLLFGGKLCGLGYNSKLGINQFSESADGGKSFTPYTLPEALQGYNYASFIPAGNKIYVLDQSRQNLYTSLDGKNWATPITIPEEIITFGIVAAQGNTVFATSGWVEGIWKSTDGGISFSKQSLPDEFAKPYISYCGPYLYIASSSAYLFSKDNGQNFSRLENPLQVGALQWNGTDVIGITPSNVVRLQTKNGIPTGWEVLGSIDSLSTIMTTENGKLYSARYNRLQFSSDNAKTWSTAALNMKAHSITAVTAAGESVIASTTEGLYRSTDKGTTWAVYNWKDGIFFPAPGLSEEKRHPSSGISISKFFSLQGNLIAFCASTVEEDRRIIVSSNAGETWVSVPNLFPNSFAADTRDAVATANSVFVCGAYIHPLHEGGGRWAIGGIMRSADGGKSWFESDNGLPTRNNISAPTSMLGATTASVYALTVEGMYRSTNEGFSWQPLSAGLNLINHIPAQLLGYGSTCYLLCSDGTSYRIHDGENAWQTATLPTGTGRLLVFDGRLIAFASQNAAQVLYEYSAGNWKNISEQFSFGRSITSLAKAGNIIVAGTATASIWQREATNVTLSAEEELQKQGQNIIQLMPNPADAHLNISLPEPARNARYIIVNNTGSEVLSGSITFGTATATINTSVLAQGVYAYRIESSTQQFSGIFTILR